MVITNIKMFVIFLSSNNILLEFFERKFLEEFLIENNDIINIKEEFS